MSKNKHLFTLEKCGCFFVVKNETTDFTKFYKCPTGLDDKGNFVYFGADKYEISHFTNPNLTNAASFKSWFDLNCTC